MGFRLETYVDSTAQLIVDFLGDKNLEGYYAGDSIQEAIQYFNLYFDADTNKLNTPSPAELAIINLEIVPSEAKDFRTNLDLIITELTDEDAEKVKILYPKWSGNGIQYIKNERVRYEGILYRVLQDHVSQVTWNPIDAPSLFDRVLKPVTGPTDWIQPGSTNGYMTGDQVIYNGIIYESLIDNNIWEPGIDKTLWIPIDEKKSVDLYDKFTVYNLNDRILWNDKIYVSLIDNNSWNPEEYPAGWELV